MSKPENEPSPRTLPLIGGLVLASLGILLVLQASGIWHVITVDSVSDTLLFYGISTLTFVAFIIFAFIFLRSLFRLRRARREKQVGSKLKSRLVFYFVAVSLLPITAMAVFSYLFFNRSLEKWFSTIPEEALNSARQVQDEARAEQAQMLRGKAELLATIYAEQPQALDAATLARLRQKSGLAAIALLNAQRELITQAAMPLPAKSQEELQETLETARTAPAPAPQLSDGQGFDAVTVPLGANLYLLAVAPYRDVEGANKNITSASDRFDKFKTVQRKVRQLGLMALALLTLLLLFASSWIALYLSRNITTPILALVKASGEIERGNLGHRVTAAAEDEVALLADAFNQMTTQLATNRDELERNDAELHAKNSALRERRIYIETVLESLSAGVISFDAANHITTRNAAANALWRIPPDADSLDKILTSDDLATVERLLARARRQGRATEQTVLARGLASDGETLPVALAATALSGDAAQAQGVVLVIEDLTDLLAAQRAAAWSDVARRLAHEIKNPLTPIQLSAERIAKRVNALQPPRNGNGNGTPLAQVVTECTATIIREVGGLKDLVDEFSRFARLPHARLEPAQLNDIAQQAIVLYEDRLDGVTLETQLAPDLPSVALDAEQMRRVLVNLIDNALEALPPTPAPRRITVATTYDAARAQVSLQVSDTGHGLAPAHLPKLFQPYFSTRGRGSGLGLAIVQRIVSEHSGRIRAENLAPHGARFTVELPA